MTRRPVVERRSLTRRTNPERELLDAEQHAEWWAGQGVERCPLRDALVTAHAAFADRYGADEAALWCAARARTGLGPMAGVKKASKAARRAAEAVFA